MQFTGRSRTCWEGCFINAKLVTVVLKPKLSKEAEPEEAQKNGTAAMNRPDEGWSRVTLPRVFSFQQDAGILFSLCEWGYTCQHLPWCLPALRAQNKAGKEDIYGHAWSERDGILKPGLSFLVTTNLNLEKMPLTTGVIVLLAVTRISVRAQGNGSLCIVRSFLLATGGYWNSEMKR